MLPRKNHEIMEVRLKSSVLKRDSDVMPVIFVMIEDTLFQIE